MLIPSLSALSLGSDYTDVAYYRLEVSGVYFVGGFGVMGWVCAEDYGSAPPDPWSFVSSRERRK